MSLKIYHNPRCSKSRNTLALIQDAGIEPTIVRYLEEAPSAAEILDLAKKLGVTVADLLRRGESEFKDASDLPSRRGSQRTRRCLNVRLSSTRAAARPSWGARPRTCTSCYPDV